MRKGLFVAIDGIAGVGKTTIVQSVADALMACGLEVVITSEPGGTQLASDVRSIMNEPGRKYDGITEMLMYSAARRSLASGIIRPALARGAIVLCDGYLLSNLATQGEDIEIMDWILEQHDTHVGLLPDMLLCLDACPVMINERRSCSSSYPGHECLGDIRSIYQIKKMQDQYKLALYKMQERYLQVSYDSQADWARIMNELPSHVTEAELTARIIQKVCFERAIGDADHAVRAAS